MPEARVIEKMTPAWIVARKRSGLDWKLRTMAARRLPLSESSCIRLLRVESTATSLAEKNPTRQTRTTTPKTSNQNASIDGAMSTFYKTDTINQKT